MNTYKFTGYVTKDYEIAIPPQNGIYPIEDMEFHFLNYILGADHNEEAKSFFLNDVYIKDGELYASATIKHSFEEYAEGTDIDHAEDELLNWGECTHDINHDHQGKPLIEIDDIERI